MRNLVWISVDAAKGYPPKIIGDNQNYDLVLHNYGDVNFKYADSHVREILIAPHQEKLNVVGRDFDPAMLDYDQYAFLDDDLEITVDDLNRLFLAGEALRLPLFQPALTRESYSSHMHLRQVPDAVVRKVHFVEIMCPFFSQSALRACLPTFDLNLSGWGLDCFIWPRKVNYECYVIDAIPIGHLNPPSRRTRVMANGKTPQQECAELQAQLSQYT